MGVRLGEGVGVGVNVGVEVGVRVKRGTRGSVRLYGEIAPAECFFKLDILKLFTRLLI